MKISREEALKIAHISRLALDEEEVDRVVQQLQEVLAYAQRVQELAGDLHDQPSNKNINIMRDGVAVPSDSQRMLERAPEREENYFVVPRILDTK